MLGGPPTGLAGVDVAMARRLAFGHVLDHEGHGTIAHILVAVRAFERHAVDDHRYFHRPKQYIKLANIFLISYADDVLSEVR